MSENYKACMQGQAECQGLVLLRQAGQVHLHRQPFYLVAGSCGAKIVYTELQCRLVPERLSGVFWLSEIHSLLSCFHEINSSYYGSVSCDAFPQVGQLELHTRLQGRV